MVDPFASDTHHLPRPRILVDPPDQAIETFLHVFERRIYENPDFMLGLIGRLGAQALSDNRENTTVTQPESWHASDLIGAYFSNRYDRESEYDEATEDALATDPHHRELIKRLHDMGGNIMVHAGVMKTVIQENKQSMPARDAVRLSRLIFFVDRAKRWQDQQNKPTGGHVTVFPNAG